MDAGTLEATAGVTLHRRLYAVMNEVEPISKERESQQRYKFARYEDLISAVKPYFVKHGILMLVDDRRIHSREMGKSIWVELQCLVSFINADTPEDKISITVHGHGIDSGDFGLSKARTQCVKEALKKILMLEIEEVSGHAGTPAGHKVPQGRGKPLPAPAYEAEPAFMLFLNDNWKAIQSTARVAIEDVTALAPLWLEFVENDLSEDKFRSLEADKGKTINKFSRLVRERLGP